MYVFCAEEIILDQQSNKLSTINHIEDIVSPSFPIALAKLGLVIILAKEDGDEEVSHPLLKLSNGEHVLVTAPVNVSFVGVRRARIIAKFEGLPLPAPAPLRIELRMGDTVIADHTIGVYTSARAEITVPKATEGAQAVVARARPSEQEKPRHSRRAQPKS